MLTDNESLTFIKVNSDQLQQKGVFLKPQGFNRETRREGRVGETGSLAHSTVGPAHSDGIAIYRSSNA